MKTEYKDDVTNFIEVDEMYPMQNYQGIAEFDLFDYNKYDKSLPGMLPHLRFHTHLKAD